VVQADEREEGMMKKKTVQNGVGLTETEAGHQMIDREAQSGEDRDRSWVLAGCER
jgi:hypothetical protein